MIKLFIKFVVPLAVVLVVGIVGYNYFAGDAEEKKQSEDIIQQAKDLGKSIASLISSETNKWDEGKYKDALGKISDTVSNAKKQAESLQDGGKEWMGKIKKLERQKNKLEKQVTNLSEKNRNGETNSQLFQQLNEQIKELADQTESLTLEMSGKKN